MKRNIFNTFVVFCIYCIFYKLGVFTFFFAKGDGQSVFLGLILLAGCFLVVSSLLHFLLDRYWVRYEQILEFTIKEKKVLEVQLAPATNTDGSPTLAIPNQDVCGHEYILVFSRKDAPEEEFEKEVCENVFKAFEEGNIVHVHKRRTIVATHYTVVREKIIMK